MFSRVIVSSLLLATLANGLVFRRDDGYYPSSSTPPALSLPMATPEPILLPDPSISLSLPPLDPSMTGTSSSILSSLSPSPSVVTSTVYVYPTQCPPNRTGDLPTPTQPTPITLPQASPLNLPPVRRDDTDSVVSKMRDLEQQVMNTYVNLGKGDVMLTVIGKIEDLISQVLAPGADLDGLLTQAQDLVNDS